MKTAEEWVEQIRAEYKGVSGEYEQFIRRIQADVLRWSVEMVQFHQDPEDRILDKAHELAPNEMQTG